MKAPVQFIDSGTLFTRQVALNHFLQRLDTLVDEILRSAAEVELADGAEVETEVVVEGGPDFLEGDGAIDGVLAEAIGRPDDLAGPHASAGQQGAGNLRPVV